MYLYHIIVIEYLIQLTNKTKEKLADSNLSESRILLCAKN